MPFNQIFAGHNARPVDFRIVGEGGDLSDPCLTELAYFIRRDDLMPNFWRLVQTYSSRGREAWRTPLTNAFGYRMMVRTLAEASMSRKGVAEDPVIGHWTSSAAVLRRYLVDFEVRVLERAEGPGSRPPRHIFEEIERLRTDPRGLSTDQIERRIRVLAGVNPYGHDDNELVDQLLSSYEAWRAANPVSSQDDPHSPDYMPARFPSETRREYLARYHRTIRDQYSAPGRDPYDVTLLACDCPSCRARRQRETEPVDMVDAAAIAARTFGLVDRDAFLADARSINRNRDELGRWVEERQDRETARAMSAAVQRQVREERLENLSEVMDAAEQDRQVRPRERRLERQPNKELAAAGRRGAVLDSKRLIQSLADHEHRHTGRDNFAALLDEEAGSGPPQPSAEKLDRFSSLDLE